MIAFLFWFLWKCILSCSSTRLLWWFSYLLLFRFCKLFFEKVGISIKKIHTISGTSCASSLILWTPELKIKCWGVCLSAIPAPNNDFNISSVFQNPPCQNNAFLLLHYSQSSNIGRESNAINSFNQPLGSSHSSDDDSIYVCHDEFPSTSYDLSVSHGDFNLDLESSSVKEYVHIQSSSSPHYPSVLLYVRHLLAMEMLHAL